METADLGSSPRWPAGTPTIPSRGVPDFDRNCGEFIKFTYQKFNN